MRDALRALRDSFRELTGTADAATRFRQLQRRLHPGTIAAHDELLDWAIAAADKDTADKDAPAPESASLAAEGLALRAKALRHFTGRLAGSPLRVLVHVPPASVSPAGYSAYTNLAQSLDVLGVPTLTQSFGAPWRETLKRFAPNALLTSDHHVYLDDIDRSALADYRQSAPLHLFLTASPEGEADAPLSQRLTRAEELGVSGYTSWHARESLDHEAYAPFHDRGLPILSVEFGANIVDFYPAPGISRDIDYVFLASSNRSKWDRYADWLAPILRERAGFVDGPGWRHARRCLLSDAPPAAQRSILARARVGLNLHLASQFSRPTELNERTYILAACGVPQLVDRPALLPRRFDEDALFVADSPAAYRDLLRTILARPDAAEKRARAALRTVFDRHTTFHRAEAFARELAALVCPAHTTAQGDAPCPSCAG
jgi:hypothetical protein